MKVLAVKFLARSLAETLVSRGHKIRTGFSDYDSGI